jgi:MFS superfamily sulfate permease-like transporter
MAKSAKKAGTPGRISQLIQAYKVTKQGDPRIGLILLATFVFFSIVGVALFILIPPPWLIFDILSGVLIGLLAALIVFGRRATKSQLTQMEGKPGAAVAVLSMLKRGWRTDQVVAFNRQQDVVHRLVGPPGIVLIGEGNPTRLKPLMGSERTRHQRVAREVPIHEITVGYGEGEVPLGKLTRHVTKMKRQVQPAEMTDLLARLRAIDANRPNIPLPKGPVPTSMKGQRGNLRGR